MKLLLILYAVKRYIIHYIISNDTVQVILLTAAVCSGCLNRSKRVDEKVQIFQQIEVIKGN